MKSAGFHHVNFLKYFFPIADLKIFSGCNGIQPIKRCRLSVTFKEQRVLIPIYGIMQISVLIILTCEGQFSEWNISISTIINQAHTDAASLYL